MVGLFEKMDPALEESSRTCGASMLRTLGAVTLPLALPGILFSLVIIFVISLGGFGVPALLGLPVGISVLGTEIWELASRYPGDYNMASAISMIAQHIIALIFIQRKIILPREFITVTERVIGQA
jgi:iron(III) transport system permease protein